jgi:hypothetical protein
MWKQYIICGFFGTPKAGAPILTVVLSAVLTCGWCWF